MSLLQNEDFAIYQLRTSYLGNVHDGVGERLINLNNAILKDPAFRSAGWSLNHHEAKRCYSPPIPTAVTSEYFQAPKSAEFSGSLPDDEEEGGMLTGTGLNDTAGPAIVRRRRRREQHEEDDSSDLSDESDDVQENADRPAQQVNFSKMPERSRADSSPLRGWNARKTSRADALASSRLTHSERPRRGSLGAVEAMKARTRRDTTTSSELSSENEPDWIFNRRKILKRQRPIDVPLSEHINEADGEEDLESEDIVNADTDSDDTSLQSDLLDSDDESTSFFEQAVDPSNESPFSPSVPSAAMPSSQSPKKPKIVELTMGVLPPPRPISTIQPLSALSAAIRAKSRKPTSPLERFATLSGRGDPNPLYVKLFAPFSTSNSIPVELLLKRSSHEGDPVTVAETIGLGLWRYTEEKLEPTLVIDKMNVNHWTLRMVEDGEVDFDFPALSRTRPITDFTSNNNRGPRGRSRDKPWDEFALVEATTAQFKDNEALTPIYSQEAEANQEGTADMASSITVSSQPVTARQQSTITSKNLAMVKKDTNPLDLPAVAVSHATPRTGATKTIKVQFTDLDARQHILTTPVTTDTYIAEVFDDACKKFNLDKALYVLKVSHSNTVAPADRTIEALGARSSLDLVRRRFTGGESVFGLGLSGSPGSTSPNAPLFLTTSGTPKKQGKRGAPVGLIPAALNFGLSGTTYKRYNVLRKQPMSFAPSHPRVLALDDEYLQILPGDSHGGPGEGKTTTVLFTSVVGCKVNRKHPKTFRLVIFKERESKRYDFEAPGGADEAAEIVAEIKRGTERFRDQASRGG